MEGSSSHGVPRVSPGRGGLLLLLPRAGCGGGQGRVWPGWARLSPSWDRTEAAPRPRASASPCVLVTSPLSPCGGCGGTGFFWAESKAGQSQPPEACGAVSVWAGLKPLLFYRGIFHSSGPSLSLKARLPWATSAPADSAGEWGPGRRREAAHQVGSEVPACLFTNVGSQAACEADNVGTAKLN